MMWKDDCACSTSDGILQYWNARPTCCTKQRSILSKELVSVTDDIDYVRLRQALVEKDTNKCGRSDNDEKNSFYENLDLDIC